jgi:hypothetical protein
MRPSLFLSLPMLFALGAAAEAATSGTGDAGLIGSVLVNTPTWVWVLLAGLVWMGLKRTQPREVGLFGIFVFPAVMVLLSLSHLVTDGLSMGSVAALGAGGVVGIAAGVSLERRHRPTPLGRGRLRLPGEWTSLIVVLGVFATRYFGAVVAAVAPVTAHSLAFQLVLGGLSAFFALLLTTRTLLRLQVALAPAATAA